MEYLFEDYPRELAKQIVNDEPTKMYYALKGMSDLIDIFEWVEGMKEKYPSFCFYPEDFDVDVLFRVCKNIKDEIHCKLITRNIKITGFGYINKSVINSKIGTRKITSFYVITNMNTSLIINDVFYSEFYCSNEDDKYKWIINNTEEE